MLKWLLNLFRSKPKQILVCMRQINTWRWPDHLGRMTEGKCELCQTPIYFEEQNKRFYKICHICSIYNQTN